MYAIHQDKEGFLWFGTQDGLNRFDGVSFKEFKHKNEDSTTLSDNYILAITEDYHNNLWVGTRNGVNRFDKTTEKVTRYYFPEIFENDFHQSVREIRIDNDSSVVMVLHDGLYSFSHHDNFSARNQIFRFEKDNPGLKVVQDVQNNFWISRTKGISCITLNKDELFYPYSNAIESGGFMVLRKNELWISDDEGLLRFSLQTKTIQRVPFENEKNNTVRFLYVDSHQRIWVTTNERMILLTEVLSGQFHQTNIEYKEGNEFGLNDKTIQTIFEDNSGLFWFGTAHGGVNVYDPLQSYFKTIDESMFKSLLPVWAICEDSRKQFWFGTSGGLVKATQRDTSKPVTSYEAIEDAFVSIEKIPIDLLSTQIYAIVEDDEHQLWVGVRGNGVVRYNVEKNRISHFVHSDNDTNSLVNNSVLSLRKTSTGDIWICTFNGISIFEKSIKSFRNLKLKSFDSTMSNYVLDVYEANDGTMWISSSTGIGRYNVKSHSFQFFKHRDDDSRSVSYNIITTCRQDKENKLWVATLGGGLNLFNDASDSFSYFTLDDGLPNEVLYGLTTDIQSNLWFSTNEGISKFNIESNKVTNFGIEEGLKFKEFALNSFYQNANGEMFFGGVGGVVAFHPDSVRENSFAPPVVLSDIKINYKSIDSSRASLVQGSYSTPKEIHLTYLEKSLTLEFVALNFRNSKMNSYQYKLEGFDEQWITPERNLRTAHYTNLPSGEFAFVVKAANNSGVWNNEGLRITIIVFPPFWLTWWFLSLVSVAVLGSVVIAVRSYSHKKLRRKLDALEVQQKIQTERERISRDLHDNVGSQLVNIISGLTIAERSPEITKDKTKSLLLSLQDDARNSMALLRQTIWALKANTLSVEEFSNELEKYIQKQCMYHEEITVRYESSFSRSVILSPIQVLNLFRITQEAFTNALKYSQAKNIFVSLSISDKNELMLVVKDDGIGMMQTVEDSFKGNGMMNMERRATELSGVFQCENKRGVTITVTVPL